MVLSVVGAVGFQALGLVGMKLSVLRFRSGFLNRLGFRFRLGVILACMGIRVLDSDFEIGGWGFWDKALGVLQPWGCCV